MEKREEADISQLRRSLTVGKEKRNCGKGGRKVCVGSNGEVRSRLVVVIRPAIIAKTRDLNSGVKVTCKKEVNIRVMRGNWYVILFFRRRGGVWSRVLPSVVKN